VWATPFAGLSTSCDRASQLRARDRQLQKFINGLSGIQIHDAPPQLLALILARNVAAGKPVRFVSQAVHLVQDDRRLSEQLYSCTPNRCRSAPQEVIGSACVRLRERLIDFRH
jgi:hypothetical protein